MVVGDGRPPWLPALTAMGLPLGLVDAVWSGVGTALIAVGSVPVIVDEPDWAAAVGIALILAVNAFSVPTHG